MIHYNLETMDRLDYKVELEKHSTAFTPNLDIAILDAYDALKSQWLKAKEYRLNLKNEGVGVEDRRKLVKAKYPLYELELTIEKLVAIKQKSSRKQKNENELREWSKGFDKYGRY